MMPLRIVHVVDDLDIGGLQRLVIDLSLEQRAIGHEPFIYTLLQRGVLADEALATGIRVRVFQKPNGFSLRTLSSMAWNLYKDGADLVHTHNPGAHPYGALAARMAMIGGVVNTRHGLVGSQGHPYRERYYRAVMPFTHRVVSVSRECQDALIARGIIGPQKAAVITNGIRPSNFLRQRVTCPPVFPNLRFGTVGRLVRVKGHNILIDAFAHVHKRLPLAQLHIMGSGPLHGSLAQQIHQLGLDGVVVLHEAGSDVSSFLQTIHIFVCSSLSEGLPLAVIEAMFASLPIVATRVGGIPDLVPAHVGWCCSPGHPDQLADTLLTAAYCPHLTQKGENARDIALRLCTAERMREDYDDVYRDVLRARGKQRCA